LGAMSPHSIGFPVAYDLIFINIVSTEIQDTMASMKAVAAVLFLAALAISPAQASRYEAVSSPQCNTINTGGWKQLIRSGEGNNLGLGALVGPDGQPLPYYVNVSDLKRLLRCREFGCSAGFASSSLRFCWLHCCIEG
jgi:hypothetical protein